MGLLADSGSGSRRHADRLQRRSRNSTLPFPRLACHLVIPDQPDVVLFHNFGKKT